MPFQKESPGRIRGRERKGALQPLMLLDHFLLLRYTLFISLVRLRVACADLHELGFGGDGLGYMCVHFHPIAAEIGANILFAEVRERSLWPIRLGQST